MYKTNVDEFPANFEEMLDSLAPEWWQDFALSSVGIPCDPPNITAFEQPKSGLTDEMWAEASREAGFWTLKNAISGQDLGGIRQAPVKAQTPAQSKAPSRVAKAPSAPVAPPPAAAKPVENNITFDVSFRGYNREQVEDYIDALTEDYNRTCARVAELEEQNKTLRTGAEAVGKAILKAEQVAYEIVTEAEEKAGRIARGAGFRPYAV